MVSPKEGARRFMRDILDDKFVEDIESEGFTFVLKQNKFKISKHGLQCHIVLNPEIDTLAFHRDETMQIKVLLTTQIYSVKYRQFLKKHWDDRGKQDLHHGFERFELLVVDEEAAALTNPPVVESIRDAIKVRSMKVLDGLANWDQIPEDISEASDELLLYAGKKDELIDRLVQKRKMMLEGEASNGQKSSNIDQLESKLVNRLNVRDLSPRFDVTTSPREEKLVVSDDIDIEFVAQIDLFHGPGYANVDLGTSGEVFATGCVGHGGVWTRDGDLLFETSLLNFPGRASSNVCPLLLESRNLVCFSREVFDYRSGEHKFSLRHELLDPKKGIANVKEFALPESGRFVSIVSNEVAVFDEEGNILSQFEPPGGVLAVRKKHEDMLVQNGSQVSFVNFENETGESFEFEPKAHCLAVSDDETQMFFGGYGPIQQWLDLETGKSKIVRSHPTHKKGYKQAYQTAHNFGCNTACFSRDKSWVATSADHGRNTLFQIPGFDRVDIQTREKFDYQWERTCLFGGRMRSPAFVGSLLAARIDPVKQNEFSDGTLQVEVFTAVDSGSLTFWNHDGEFVGETEDVSDFYVHPNSDLLLVETGGSLKVGRITVSDPEEDQLC